MSNDCRMCMTECYGCGYPMQYAFRTYEIDGETIPYGMVCWLTMKVKGIEPGEHEPGTVSNGSQTMRRRAE